MAPAEGGVSCGSGRPRRAERPRGITLARWACVGGPLGEGSAAEAAGGPRSAPTGGIGVLCRGQGGAAAQSGSPQPVYIPLPSSGRGPVHCA